MSAPVSGPETVAEHLANCTDAKAAIVVDGSADDVIAQMTAAGWTLEERVDHVAGKRIRFLKMPARDAADREAGTADLDDEAELHPVCGDCGLRHFPACGGEPYDDPAERDDVLRQCREMAREAGDDTPGDDQ